MDTNSEQRIKSPCNGTCKLDDKVCVGCGRTVWEISNWTKLTSKQKKEINERVKRN